MKKTTTILLFIIGFTSTIFSQFNLDKDTSWTSLLQNSQAHSVKFDDYNNYYLTLSKYTNTINEAGATNFLQKRNANNELVWEKSFNSTRIRIVGFDYYNNPILAPIGEHVGVYGDAGSMYRFKAQNGDYIDSTIVFSSGSISSVQKYNGDLLIYGYKIARFTSEMQPIWILEDNINSYPPVEPYSFIRNDTLFYVSAPSTEYTNLMFVKLNTGFTGVINNKIVSDNTINCGGTILANGNDYTVNINGIVSVNGGVSTQIVDKTGFLCKTESQNEFILVSKSNNQYVVTRYNLAGAIISSVNLPSSFYLSSSPKKAYYSHGYTLVFGVLDDKLQILMYDINLNLVNQYTSDGDPGSFYDSYWTSYSSNNAGCFVVVGTEFYGTKNNATLVKYCTADASINEIDLNAFSLFPNPTSSKLTIRFEETSEIPVVFSLYDLSGKIILEQKTNATSENVIDVSNFAPGTYLLRAGSSTQRVVIE